MSGSLTGFTAAALAVHFWRLNSSNIAVGSGDPDNLVNGTIYHALRATGFISSATPEITRDIATNKGDQSILGQLDLGASAYGQFDVQLSTDSATLKAALGDSLVDITTLSSAVISASNTHNPTLPQIGCMFTTKYQSMDSASLGQVKYRTVVFPSATAQYKDPGASQGGGDNPNPVTLTVTPTLGGAFPGGNAFSATQGWYNNQSLFYSIVADAPFALSALVGDAAETDIVLAYKPTTTATGSVDHLFTSAGVVVVPTSITIATATVVLAAAPAAAAIAVALYQTNFQTV